MNVYGGKNASAGKMFARSLGYRHTSLKRDYKPGMKHVCIASRDCGDIITLLGFGWPADSIVACDIDPEARAAAAKYGVIVSPVGPIEDTILWVISQGWTPLTVNVDLCNTMIFGAPILMAVAAAVNCILMYTYRRGRDAKILREYGLTKASPQHAKDGAREHYIAKHLGRSPSKHEFYQSDTPSSHGDPMGVMVFLPEPGKPVIKYQEVSDSPTPVYAPAEAVAEVKAMLAKPTRTYKCKACLHVGEHPMTHRKVCTKR